MIDEVQHYIVLCIDKESSAFHAIMNKLTCVSHNIMTIST
jgi:hypothetical protein